MTKKDQKPEEKLVDVTYLTIGSAVVQVLIGPDKDGFQMWLDDVRQ